MPTRSTPLARADYELHDNLWARPAACSSPARRRWCGCSDAARARCPCRAAHRGLRQRLPRLAAGRVDQQPGRRALSSPRPACASCRPSTRSSPPRRCWARSASSPTPSARSTACSRSGTARARRRSRRRRDQARQRLRQLSPRGVLVVAGDDHGCVSSSMPHQSEGLFRRSRCRWWRRPTWPEILGVWAVRLGAVALLGQLGRADRAVGGGGKRHDGGPRRDQRTRRGVGRCRRGARRHRPRRAGRRPALPLARSAQPAHRIAPARQAGCGARLRARQQHRPRGDRRAGRERGHRHLRQGALRPDGGAAPSRDHAGDAGRGRRAALQRWACPSRSRRRARRPLRAACARSSWSRRRRPSSRRSCASCSTTPRSGRGRRSSANTMRKGGRWCRRSANCGPRA